MQFIVDRWKQRFDQAWFSSAVTTYVVACLLFGGGTRSGFAGDVLLQLLAVPMALWASWRLLAIKPHSGAGRGRGIVAMAVVGAVLGLHVLQLIPLPPWLWSLFPQREAMLANLQIVGVDPPWLPISVSARATWLNMLGSLPPIAVFLGAIQMSFPDRRILTVSVLSVGLASVLLGLLQVAQGRSSGLRFFETTNDLDAVGFFANRNHFSSLLYTILLLAAAWLLLIATKFTSVKGKLRTRDAMPRIIGVIGAITVLVVLIAAQIMARSRAGIGLTIAALACTLLLAYLAPRTKTSEVDTDAATTRKSVARMSTRFVLAGLAISCLILTQFALTRALERFDKDPLSDARIAFSWNTIEAARAYMPFGSGMGTFVSVYKAFEKPTDGTTAVFANRAHNDFLEFWLEAGMFGLIAIVGFIVWLGIQTARIWRRGIPNGEDIDNLLACAASLGMIFLLIHSIFDYPLRTAAMASVFMICLVLTLRPVGVVLAAQHDVATSEAGEMAPKPRPDRPRRPVTPARHEPVLTDMGGRLSPKGGASVDAALDTMPAARPRRPFVQSRAREDWPEAWTAPPNVPRGSDNQG